MATASDFTVLSCFGCRFDQGAATAKEANLAVLLIAEVIQWSPLCCAHRDTIVAMPLNPKFSQPLGIRYLHLYHIQSQYFSGLHQHLMLFMLVFSASLPVQLVKIH